MFSSLSYVPWVGTSAQSHVWNLVNPCTAHLVSIQWQAQQQELRYSQKCGVALAFIPRIKLSSLNCPFKNLSTADLYLVFNFLFACSTPPWDNSNPPFLLNVMKIFLRQVFILIMYILLPRDMESCDNYPGGSFIFFQSKGVKCDGTNYNSSWDVCFSELLWRRKQA